MGFYITVEAEVDLEEYQDEINNIMLKKGKTKTFRNRRFIRAFGNVLRNAFIPSRDYKGGASYCSKGKN